MIEQLASTAVQIVAVRVSGTLHDADYRLLEQLMDKALHHHQRLARLYIQFEDFHGWDLHAAWDDLKFGTRHYADLERIVLVGELRSMPWMVRLLRLFSRAEVRGFPLAEVPEAWAWLHQDI
ncbi:STAS/SEC14 domain-containing protein [Vogesella oryzae]|uniref:STAS/SEC14 domain-containing protein n=1 Tax=Vogesella oryzae TaxID=1735285 RepID=UPI001581F822|nr:STAS/SEC14 domain-containing protein [Vogesella oryzae]